MITSSSMMVVLPGPPNMESQKGLDEAAFPMPSARTTLSLARFDWITAPQLMQSVGTGFPSCVLRTRTPAEQLGQGPSIVLKACQRLKAANPNTGMRIDAKTSELRTVRISVPKGDTRMAATPTIVKTLERRLLGPRPPGLGGRNMARFVVDGCALGGTNVLRVTSVLALRWIGANEKARGSATRKTRSDLMVKLMKNGNEMGVTSDE